MSALVVFEAVEASHVPLRLSHRPERSREFVRTPGHPSDKRGCVNGHQSVRLSAPTHRRALAAAEPLALAGQVVARDSALHRALLPVDRVRRRERHRLLRDPLHGPLPEGAVRVQRRRPSLVVARWLLQLQRTRHRQIPALHAQRRARLSSSARGRVPRVAFAGSRADQVVAPCAAAVRRRRGLRRRRLGRRGQEPTTGCGPREAWLACWSCSPE